MSTLGILVGLAVGCLIAAVIIAVILLRRRRTRRRYEHNMRAFLDAITFAPKDEGKR